MDTEEQERQEQPETEELLEEDRAEQEHERNSHVTRNVLVVLLVLLIAVTVGYIRVYSQNEDDIDVKDLGDAHKWLIADNFFDQQTLKSVKDILETSIFETKTNDPNTVESAGEAVLAGHPDCDHPYMTLNSNRTFCHFSNRIDVGNHFIASGGFDGKMESYDKLITRMITFHKKYLDLNNFKIFHENQAIQSELKNLCYDNYDDKTQIANKDDMIADLYQLDLVLVLAGQEIPMHLDVPYFFGADRTTIPQWLLVVMKQSRLFDELFIPDLKGVLWLTEHEEENGGHVYLYPYKEYKNRATLLKTKFNQAILYDGTRVIHGSNRFKPNKIPTFFNHKSYYYYIKYDNATQNWSVYDANHNLIESYSYDDVQISAVWRMHCFKNAEEKEKFYTQSKDNVLSIDKIADRFKAALKARNMLPSGKIKYLDLWAIILKEFVKYPETINKKSNFMFFNYCLLPRMMPKFINVHILNPLLKDLC